MSFFDWLGSLWPGNKKGSTKRLSEKAFIPSGGAETSTPKIILSPLARDKGGNISKRLGTVLTDIAGVEVFSLKNTLRLPEGAEDPMSSFMAAADEGRAWIKDEGADFLLWGEVAKEGDRVTLRLLPAPATGGGSGAGSFEGLTDVSGIGETLEIPTDFNPDLEPVIAAMVLATFGPTFKGARTRLGETLGGYMEAIGPMIENLPMGITNAQELSILNGIGNAHVAYSHLGGGAKQLGLAAKAYKKAEERVSKEAQPIAWASIQNHLAAVLVAQGQMKKDAAPLKSASLIYSNIAAALNAKTQTNDWCMAQTNLGRSLYILAGIEAKPEYLKTASAAYEAALGCCNQITAPTRWADITNQYGVVLLALGEEIDGPPALEQAVAKFRDAIKVHNRDRAPVLWAQTANNLGAACFALAKHNSQNSLLREATDYFEGATKIYREQGVPKQAEVIEKNLHRVKRLLISRGG